MSRQQGPMPWYKAFDRSSENERDLVELSTVITQAEEAFESGQYHELISLIETTLEKSDVDIESEVVLRCLLNEALCELSRYEEAQAVLTRYETEPVVLPNKLQAELLLRIGATCSWLAQYPKAIARLNEAVRIFTITSDCEGI